MAMKLAGSGPLVRGPRRRADDGPPSFGRLQDALRASARAVSRTMTALHLPTPRSWRRRSMDARAVVEVLDALAAAGVKHWIAGGWGVDALLGEQTRTHDDLDLVIAAAPVLRQRRQTEDAKRALESLGYRFERDDIHLGAWFVERILLRHASGRRVELLPIDERAEDYFATGVIRGREVPCLSADAQLRIHTGYRRTGADLHDLDALYERLGLESPAPDRKMEPGWR